MPSLTSLPHPPAFGDLGIRGGAVLPGAPVEVGEFVLAHLEKISEANLVPPHTKDLPAPSSLNHKIRKSSSEQSYIDARTAL